MLVVLEKAAYFTKVEHLQALFDALKARKDMRRMPHAGSPSRTPTYPAGLLTGRTPGPTEFDHVPILVRFFWNIRF